MRLLSVLLGVVACNNDVGLTKQASCDGVLQQGEETVDGPFDGDGDGAFDGTNPDCAATYAAEDLDCDDADPEIKPGAAEVECSGIDEDCDEATPDGDDVDGDGYTTCDDCADAEPEVNPGAVEVACNDLDDDCDEGTADSEDADADGATSCDDCNDADAAVGPGVAETLCNAVDDDCDDTTPDEGEDLDLDGWAQCDDCDDADATLSPSATEIPCNGIDEDCNSRTADDDGSCETDYSDTWDLDSTPSYSCIWGLISIEFDQVLIDDAYPDVTVNALGGGAQPGEMTGTFTSSTEFSASEVVPGACREVYTFEAAFTSSTTFEGTFTAEFIGGSSACFDCTTQSWTVTGSR